MAQLLGSLFVIALGTGMWYVALNKKAREWVALWKVGFRRGRTEDRDTLEALFLGLGIVFGLFFHLLGLLGLIEFFQGGRAVGLNQ